MYFVYVSGPWIFDNYPLPARKLERTSEVMHNFMQPVASIGSSRLSQRRSLSHVMNLLNKRPPVKIRPRLWILQYTERKLEGGLLWMWRGEGKLEKSRAWAWASLLSRSRKTLPFVSTRASYLKSTHPAFKHRFPHQVILSNQSSMFCHYYEPLALQR